MSSSSPNDDDLEYYITFPSPTSSYIGGDSYPPVVNPDDIALGTSQEHKMVSVQTIGRWKSNTEPVVFLLGWLGATDRHLAKYAAMYNQIGCITVRYTAPASYIFVTPDTRLKPIAKKLLNLLEDTGLTHHPVLFHSFSNNGSILYHYMSEVMKGSNMQVQVKGCIFDSTPGPRRLLSGVRAAYRSVRGALWVRLLISSALCVYLSCWGMLAMLVSVITGRPANPPPWCLLQEERRVPQLFLYSASDDIIYSSDVEAFASHRKELGVEVVTKDFGDSSHVSHYKKYCEEYTNTVERFVHLCFRY